MSRISAVGNARERAGKTMPWRNVALLPAYRQRQIARCRSPNDAVLYLQRHKKENMFGKLKDWRHIHTRCDRCTRTLMSAICIAATVIFWLNQ